MTVSVTFVVDAVRARDEIVCVVGNDSQLGSWNPSNALQLSKTDSNNWTGSVTLNPNSSYSYRYFVCKVFDKKVSGDNNGVDGGPVIDIVWSEAHRQPRQFETDGVHSESKGWLMPGVFEIHLRLHGNPVKLMNGRQGKCQVHCVPIDYSPSVNGSNEGPSPSTSTDVLVSNLNSRECMPVPQDHKGVIIGAEDFLVFRCRTSHLNLGFQLEVSACQDDDASTPIGCAYFLPENLPESQTVLPLAIIDSSAKPVGSIQVDVLVARPVPGMTFDMESCDQSYWDWRSPDRKPLDVGHRGMGGSYSVANPYKENTVASFNAAYKFGAKFIETDILLTKDLIPVIFHDFSTTTAIQNKSGCQSACELYGIPIHDLTLEEIRCKKFFTSKGKEITITDGQLSEGEGLPFPTLATILTEVEGQLGFDLEVKYPQMEVTGQLECETKIDLNAYLDNILRVIYQHAKDRPIFFSTFNPEICTLLKLKQSRYPVAYLSQGKTQIYTNFKDFRSNSFPHAINFALSEGILGLVLHTEVLLQDMSVIEEVLNKHLILFVWGEHNNDPEMVKRMRQCQVDGVIYDSAAALNVLMSTRIDLYKPENNANNGQDVSDKTSPLRRKQAPTNGEGSPKKQSRY